MLRNTRTGSQRSIAATFAAIFPTSRSLDRGESASGEMTTERRLYAEMGATDLVWALARRHLAHPSTRGICPVFSRRVRTASHGPPPSHSPQRSPPGPETGGEVDFARLDGGWSPWPLTRRPSADDKPRAAPPPRTSCGSAARNTLSVVRARQSSRPQFLHGVRASARPLLRRLRKTG